MNCKEAGIESVEGIFAALGAPCLMLLPPRGVLRSQQLSR